MQVGTSGGEGLWGLGRVAGWGQRAGQTTKAVGDKVGQSGKTAYRYKFSVCVNVLRLFLSA